MGAEMIFDGEDAIFGRIGSVVAKELLKGNSVTIINSEKIIFSGNKADFVKKMRAKLKMGRGSSLKGPKYSRREDFILKRMLRGMLPWDRTKGRDAYQRLRCYIGQGNLKEVKTAIKLKYNKPQRYFDMKSFVEALK